MNEKRVVLEALSSALEVLRCLYVPVYPDPTVEEVKAAWDLCDRAVVVMGGWDDVANERMG